MVAKSDIARVKATVASFCKYTKMQLLSELKIPLVNKTVQKAEQTVF